MTTEQRNRLKLYNDLKKNPAMGTFRAIQGIKKDALNENDVINHAVERLQPAIEKHINERINEIEEKLENKLDSLFDSFKESISLNVSNQIKESIKKIKPIKGEDGKPPSDERLLALIAKVLPPPIPPKDGKTHTKEELVAIIAPLIKQEFTPVVEKAPELGSEKPSFDQIVGIVTPIIRRMMTETRKGWFGGGAGGDLVGAGDGVTITTNAIGRKIISASFTPIAPTGTVNGSNQTFVFSTAPSTIVVDGVPKRKTQSDGTANWTGTTTVVLAVAPNFDVYGF